MTASLGRLTPTRKTGNESVHSDGLPIAGSVLDFWRWSSSDLLSNTTRGIVAEYLVALAVSSPAGAIRNEWDDFDLTTPEGVRVEVKSAAYIQSWHQTKESTIQFRVPKTLAWSPETNEQETVPKRQADVYVFALLHKRQDPDPLNVRHWTFYVLAARTLDARARSQHSITLASLVKEAQALAYEELAGEVRRVARAVSPSIGAAAHGELR